MYPVLFRIGPISIYSYGLMIAIAFLVGIFLAAREAKREGIEPERILDLSLYVLIAAIVGARSLFVLLDLKYYLERPWEIIMLQRGGLVFYGGFILVVIVAIWYLKANRLPTWKVADICAPSVAIGETIARIGCFLNGCCYGIVHPWGVVFPSLGDDLPHLPTQLFSSFAALVIYALLLTIRKRKKYDGQVFWSYVLLYALFRFIIEIFRGDERGGTFFGFLSISQLLAIITSLIALLAIKRLKVEGLQARIPNV